MANHRKEPFTLIVGDSRKRIGRGAGAEPPRGRALARPIGSGLMV